MIEDPDNLINDIVQHTFQEGRDAELMRRAIDMIGALRIRLENQREELKLSEDIIRRQEQLLMKHRILP